jgi:hypothetical protein
MLHANDLCAKVTILRNGKQKQLEDRTRLLMFTEKQHHINRTKFKEVCLFHCRAWLSQEIINPAFHLFTLPCRKLFDVIIGSSGVFIKPNRKIFCVQNQ